MKSEAETLEMKNTEEYRNNITLNLLKISGDIGHIKEKVDENNKHLQHINGRLRSAENSISAIKAIGITITSILTIAMGFIGILG